ncbi:hypothetical protein C8Q74DRAFT_708005 [Fomes fomentarius]|nr:hypothetical protein C8Q74DRAFT_708005 [Fomes fomentarius]
MLDSFKNAEVIAAAHSARLKRISIVSTAGLHTFDYAITFGREVDLFWRKKITFSSIIFFANRYLSSAVAILIPVWALPEGDTYWYVQTM